MPNLDPAPERAGSGPRGRPSRWDAAGSDDPAPTRGSGLVRVTAHRYFGFCSGRRPRPTQETPVAKILSNVRSDRLSFVFLLVVLASTFLF